MAVLTQITSRSLADNAVSSAKIQDGAIAAADVGTNSITATELADDAVDTAALADGAVDADRLATNAVTTVKLASSAITKEKIAAEAIQVNPHIIPDVLYPAVAGKDLSGTALGGSYTYGTAHTDGKSYYYTDIKGSKPIKDPRIGGHFGSQRHKTKSLQLLEQETATHGSNVYSIDGREWVRAVGPNFEVENNVKGNGIKISKVTTDTNFIEIVGYFNDVNIVRSTAADNDQLRVALNGGTIQATDLSISVDTPLVGRYVDDGSVINLTFNSTPALAINTVKILNTASDEYHIHAVELITQDTSNVNNIQIPSQNVVSYGKKFNVSGTPHYDPFNGFTSGSSVTAYVDTATSLGVEGWKNSSTYYRPYNGGRVVRWVDSSGVIKTSVNMMPPNAQNVGGTAISAKANASVANNTYLPTFSGTVDHSQAEVAKTFNWREFGNGNANGGATGTYKDISMLDGTFRDVAYVMDDGLTSFSGNDIKSNGNNPDLDGSGGYVYLTFIGTGFTISGSDGTEHIVQNLPYGTHILKFKDSDIHCDGVEVHSSLNIMDNSNKGTEYTFHQPKMPLIPEDAVIISDYMLMADFVPDTVGNSTTISKGVRRNNNSRDLFYDETDNGAITFTIAEASPAGFTAYLADGSASSATAFKVRLPSFGTNFVHRGHSVASKSDQYIADSIQTSTDGSATGDTSAHYLASNQTLGVYNFGHNAKSGQAGNIEAYDIVTPIHSSSHYQTFETPFLNELVGGDRNMEQTNLVVTPDGKTWDEVTRDVSYIGSLSLRTTNNANYGTAASVHINDEWRGFSDGIYGLMNKDFAIAYDRVICLKAGEYQLFSLNISNDQDNEQSRIKVNGVQIIVGYIYHSTGNNESSSRATLSLNRGDYIQILGANSIYNHYTTFEITRM